MDCSVVDAQLQNNAGWQAPWTELLPLQKPALAVVLLRCCKLCPTLLLNPVQVFGLLVRQDIIIQAVLDPAQVRAQRCLTCTPLIHPP